MTEQVAFAIAVAGKQDRWVAANGGTEEPFISRSGARLLYCFNPALQQHAYIDVNQDMILTDEEARARLMVY